MDLGQRVQIDEMLSRHPRHALLTADRTFSRGSKVFRGPRVAHAHALANSGSPTNISKAVTMTTDRSKVPPIRPRVLVFWSRAHFLHQHPRRVTAIRVQGLMNCFHSADLPRNAVTQLVQKFPENSSQCS
jgi:hypothetical protein